jgi:hypothetical protein
MAAKRQLAGGGSPCWPGFARSPVNRPSTWSILTGAGPLVQRGSVSHLASGTGHPQLREEPGADGRSTDLRSRSRSIRHRSPKGEDAVAHLALQAAPDTTMANASARMPLRPLRRPDVGLQLRAPTGKPLSHPDFRAAAGPDRHSSPMSAVLYAELGTDALGEPSAAIRCRVDAARPRQRESFRGKSGFQCQRPHRVSEVRKHCGQTSEVAGTLCAAVDVGLSALWVSPGAQAGADHRGSHRQ